MTSIEILMPSLSDSMEEGTILTWLKPVGSAIAAGEELVEIETDKANMSYESEVEGTLLEVLADAGETVPVGRPIARVGEPGDAPAPAAEQAVASAGERAPRATKVRIKASPLARRIAGERGVDLAGLRGSGPGGRIRKVDVEAAVGAPAVSQAAPAIAAPSPAPAPVEAAKGAVETAKGAVESVTPTKLQTAVARRMSEAKATAPHFYLQSEVDMSAAVGLRAELKASIAEGEVVPSLNDMVIKAAALALKEFPKANGSYRDGAFEFHSRVNVGIAVAAEDALIVPTIVDADRKGLGAIAAEARALAAKVRDGSITQPELSGGTFTVSNLGMYGVTSFQAVVNPPQAAILALGEVAERPVVRAGELAVAATMLMTLSCDHRILYGSEGAEFLARLRSLLEAPLLLLLATT